MNQTLSKNFEPQHIEEKWYRHWMDNGYFKSVPDNRPPFTVVIPPPNVTGVLHMGHTLNETVQDILVRHARQHGYNACWVPGSDHASIATEAKVVQQLERDRGIKKENLTREEFLRHAFEWKEKYGNIIYEQIKKLGCSVDWDRVTFTMDDHYYKAVIKVFVDLYNKGLIYRGARMINWDPAAKTALSDEEVEHRDVEGKLYYVKYHVLKDQEATDHSSEAPEYIIIATQRPETIMGDTAVCVNPDDERYQHLKGKYVRVPLVNRDVPVIFDTYVDPAFGTGALKVTPAHDINDYNLGLKHQLPIVDTLNEDGTLSAAAQVFVGMDRFIAREKVVEQLRQEGLLVKEETYNTRLGFSQRTSAVVEPRLSTQWFVRMQHFAQEALQAVANGSVKINPEERFLATYKYWLENIKDWCISRQLWWGQRIPAWYDKEGRFVVAENEQQAKAQFATQYKVQDAVLTQDDDVLDTWFSSWLWPIEVFNGITNPGNPDINYYYPTSVLVTGQDIIFFWVARMIMAGMEYQHQEPFKHVYFTGMVRDKQGRKMSKSLGNSPDLLQLIDRFGADAVRFGIMIAAPAGNDLLFDDSSCDQGRSFNNKLWNALKLVKMWEEKQTSEGNEAAATFAIEWFENRLNQVRAEVEEMYNSFRLSEALKTTYSLVWDDFCSWYLEWIKPAYGVGISTRVYEATIDFFGQLLQLLHPFMPFVTEEIYHQLRQREAGDDVCVMQFVPTGKIDKETLSKGEIIKADITAIRDARKKYNIKNTEQLNFMGNPTADMFYGKNQSIFDLLKKQTNLFYFNDPADPVEYSKNEIIVTSSTRTFFLHVEKQVDKSAQRAELEKELKYLKGFLQSVEKKLSNERFVQNAKPEVVEIERRKKADAEQKIKTLEESLQALG